MAVQLNLVLTNENQSFVYIIEWENNNRYGRNITDELCLL